MKKVYIVSKPNDFGIVTVTDPKEQIEFEKLFINEIVASGRDVQEAIQNFSNYLRQKKSPPGAGEVDSRKA